MNVRDFVACGTVVVAFVVSACSSAPAEQTAAPAAETPPAAEAPATEAFVPGLGEIMTLNQMRHMKLWFAGEAGNWPLAAYELEELHEGMDDAGTFHPTHKDSPVPIPEVIAKIMTDPLDQLEKAIEAKDSKAFAQAFDAVTA